MQLWNSDFMNRVDSGEGRDRFIDLYEMTPEQMIEHYSLIPRELPSHVRHIAEIEALDNSIDCVWSIKEGEKVLVYTEYDNRENGKYFEQEGFCFFELIRDGKSIAMWCFDNHPFDVTDKDFEEDEYPRVKALSELIFKYYNFKEEGIALPTLENTVFVQQL